VVFFGVCTKVSRGFFGFLGGAWMGWRWWVDGLDGGDGWMDGWVCACLAGLDVRRVRGVIVG